MHTYGKYIKSHDTSTGRLKTCRGGKGKQTIRLRGMLASRPTELTPPVKNKKRKRYNLTRLPPVQMGDWQHRVGEEEGDTPAETSKPANTVQNKDGKLTFLARNNSVTAVGLPGAT